MHATQSGLRYYLYLAQYKRVPILDRLRIADRWAERILTFSPTTSQPNLKFSAPYTMNRPRMYFNTMANAEQFEAFTNFTPKQLNK
jgi:hypothetical protein